MKNSRGGKDLVTWTYLFKRMFFTWLTVIWGIVFYYVAFSESNTIIDFFSTYKQTILIYSVGLVLGSISILFIKPIKKAHQKYLQKFLNDERKRLIRYKIYFYVGLVAIILTPFLLAYLKTAVVILTVKKISQLLLMAIVLVIFVVEIIVEKI